MSEVLFYSSNLKNLNLFSLVFFLLEDGPNILVLLIEDIVETHWNDNTLESNGSEGIY